MNKRTKEVTSILLAVSMIFSTGIKQKEVVALPPEKINIEEPDFFEKIYNNNTFRLKEYVEHERKYSTIDEEGVQVLQDLYYYFSFLYMSGHLQVLYFHHILPLKQSHLDFDKKF